MLRENAGRPLRVFIVWEPVILTDIAPPTSRVLSKLSDARVSQFWDRDRLLSREIVRTALADSTHTLHEDYSGEGSIVWDFIAVFPPGARWGPAVPSPDYHGAPVFRVIDEVRRRLQ